MARASETFARVVLAGSLWLGACGGGDEETTSSASSFGSGSVTTAAADASSDGTGSDTTGTSSGGALRGPRVRMQTAVGDLVFEIDEEAAPITAANFLRYVDEGRFAGASFYRTVTLDNQPDDDVKIEVIQGGIGAGDPDALPPIEHETTAQTGILHLDGTLSMARAAVGTATSEFFVCIGDQPELDYGGARNPDGEGFAAFGRLVEGTSVAVAIHESPEAGQTLDPSIAITSIARE